MPATFLLLWMIRHYTEHLPAWTTRILRPHCASRKSSPNPRNPTGSLPDPGAGMLISLTKSQPFGLERTLTGTRGRDLLALHQGVLHSAWREEPRDRGRLAARGVAEVCHQDATVELRDSRSLR